MLRSQHAEATRRAVLDAARSLFGRQGYAQTSVDEIADAARVTKGAVYHHFAGKEALFRAVYAEVEAEAQARVMGAGDPEGPPVDQIVAMMNAYLDAALDVEIRRITLVDGPAIVGNEPDDTAQQQPGYLAVRAFLATSMASGQLIELDPGTLTDLVGGLAWVAGLLIARAGDPDETRAALGQALDAMLRGLAPGTRRRQSTGSKAGKSCSRSQRVAHFAYRGYVLYSWNPEHWKPGSARWPGSRPAMARRSSSSLARSRIMTCGATSSPSSKTATAASRSTFRSERIPGHWTRARTGRPRRWPGCCLTALSCSTWTAPPWSSTTPPAGCSCCRWPAVTRRSGGWTALS